MSNKPIKQKFIKRKKNPPNYSLRKNQGGTKRRLNLHNTFMVIFTGALVLCNIFLYRATIKQIDVAKISADAAKKSADVAEKSISIAEESFKIENRAYVVIEYVSIDSLYFRKDNAGWITYKNIGKTPAKNLKVVSYTFCDIDEITIDEIIKIKNDLKQIVIVETTLGSNIIKQQMLPISKATQNIRNEIINGNIKLYAFGTIKYNDIFGYPHFTNFCDIYRNKSNTTDVAPIHNETN